MCVVYTYSLCFIIYGWVNFDLSGRCVLKMSNMFLPSDSTTVKGYVNAGVLPVFPSDIQCCRIVEEPRLRRVRETTSTECIVAGISCGDNSS